MILYHVITTYQLLCAMTINAHNKQRGVLLMPEWIKNKFQNSAHLSKCFKKVIINDANYRFLHSEKENKEYYESLLGDIKEYDQILVWGAQFSFGVFLEENKYRYIYCEEATGMLSRSYILKHIDCLSVSKKDYYEYTKELGLYDGRGLGVKKIICNFEAQLENFNCDGMQDFNLVKELNMLSKEERNDIISFFTDLSKIQLPNKSNIVFTQHLANLRLITYEQQILMYQIFVDYFSKGLNIAIKPHPDDLIPYSRIFPDATIVRERFPSEFLPFLVDNQPKKISTIYSTAIYNLRGYYKDVFELDMQYEKLYSRTHRYAMAIEIAKKLDNKIYLYGCYEVLMEKLAELISCDVHIIHDLEQFPQDGVVLIDDIDSLEHEVRQKLQNILGSLSKNNTVIFLNSLNDYCWYSVNNKEIWEHIKPIVLKKQQIIGMEDYEYFYESLEDETMYVYSYNEEILNSIGSMKMNKQLDHVGIIVTKEDLSKQEERIKILEGILDATEQRLLYYINRVKELENK